jgi:hypothetical protein
MGRDLKKQSQHPTGMTTRRKPDMPAQLELRSALFDAAVAFLKGETSGFEFDERRTKIWEDCLTQGDCSAARAAEVFWLFYDDFTDHPISTTQEGWNLFCRYAAFLRTASDLESHVFRQKHRGQRYALWSLAALLAALVISVTAGLWPVLFFVWIVVGILRQSAWLDSDEPNPDAERLLRFAPFWSQEDWDRHSVLLESAQLPAYDQSKHCVPWKRNLGLFWPSYIIGVLFCPLSLPFALRPQREEIFMVKQHKS